MNLKSALLMMVIAMQTVLCYYNSELKNFGNCPNLKTSLVPVRKRRHLAFPTGSAVSVTTSATKTFMTHVPSGWFLVVEAELVYKLPDAEFIAASKRRKLHHRQKKEAWDLLQSAFDSRNINGRVCVLRSICEAKMHLAPKGKSLVHDILRSLFTSQEDNEIFF
ncbi:unnamed protein product [Arctia plantaginis]|uniref:Uncharacterized protein n=1 Tax=Arctia plantaginis TaxID=874455 RepID=A0A8S1BKB8_ARCPL|nr:unnamed protein product [Arctia plantaginis]